MKDFPLQEKSLVAQNHELVRLHLDIGQCRFIHKLINQECQRMLDNSITDKNDAVLMLACRFEAHAYPGISKTFHRDESLDAYIDDSDRDDLNELLSLNYVHGVFSHE